tara:strand:+ start:445 stop:849 length:405 start_codon:yes stop_codon:yes gene_type:complete
MKKLLLFFILFFSYSFADSVYECYEIETYGRFAESDKIEIFTDSNFIISVKDNIIEYRDMAYLGTEIDYVLKLHIITNNDLILNGAFADNNLINFGFISLNKQNNKLSKVVIDENNGETIQYGICNDSSVSSQF